MIDILKPLIKKFMPFAKERMGFNQPPRLFLKNDNDNANNPLGKTAYYDPNEKSITVYVTGRHPKDVMRSISHELVHHTQCCRGDLEGEHDTGAGYAQNDDHMREMEREAYEVGNMCFRDWEDSVKGTIYYEHLKKGENKMSTKDWKNKELTQLLSEAWGFKFNTLEEFDEFNGEGELQAEEAAEVETDAGINEEEEQLDEAHCAGKRDVKPCGKEDCPKCGSRRQNEADENDGETLEEEEELDEQSKTDRPDRVAGRDTAGRRLDEEEDEIEEGEKKDHDGDGDIDSKDYMAAKDKAIKKAMNKRPTKEQLEAVIKKAITEALQKRKG